MDYLTQNTILRISDKKTLQLVEEVKKNECLWNTTLYDYPNRCKRHNAAERIARILNVPNFESRHVLTKFRNLRNSYCQELKKIGSSMAETGSEDAPGTYKPKVRWFQIMDTFMRPHVNSNILMMVRQPYTENEVENGNQSGHEWVVVAPGMIPEPSYVLEVSDDSQSSGGHLHTPTYGIAEPRDIHSDTTEDFEQVYPNRSTATQNLLAQVTHAREDDLFDHFGKYIAALLRTKPQERAQKLQAKIVNMIIQDPENDNGRGEPREITEIVETIETLETVVTRTFAADEYPTYQFLPLNPINLSSQFNS